MGGRAPAGAEGGCRCLESAGWDQGGDIREREIPGFRTQTLGPKVVRVGWVGRRA